MNFSTASVLTFSLLVLSLGILGLAFTKYACPKNSCVLTLIEETEPESETRDASESEEESSKKSVQEEYVLHTTSYQFPYLHTNQPALFFCTGVLNPLARPGTITPPPEAA